MCNHLAGWWLTSPGSHLHRVSDEFGSEMISDRPTNNMSGPRVNHDGEIDLAVTCWVFGDIHDPEPMRPVRVKRPVHEIVGGIAVAGTRAALVAFRVVNPNCATGPHQSLTCRLRASNPAAEAKLFTNTW